MRVRTWRSLALASLALASLLVTHGRRAASATPGAAPTAERHVELSRLRVRDVERRRARAHRAGDGHRGHSASAARSERNGGASRRSTPRPTSSPTAARRPQSVDYDRLLADIAALRARVAAVSDTLFHSSIAVLVETSGDHGRIARLTVSLDDGIVWTSPAGFRADDMRQVYEQPSPRAPRRHRRGRAQATTATTTFRATQRSRFIVDVPRDRAPRVEVKLWDDSNMGGDFTSDRAALRPNGRMREGQSTAGMPRRTRPSSCSQSRIDDATLPRGQPPPPAAPRSAARPRPPASALAPRSPPSPARRPTATPLRGDALRAYHAALLARRLGQAETCARGRRRARRRGRGAPGERAASTRPSRGSPSWSSTRSSTSTPTPRKGARRSSASATRSRPRASTSLRAATSAAW